MTPFLLLQTPALDIRSWINPISCDELQLL
jgi:hypothetical protein